MCMTARISGSWARTLAAWSLDRARLTAVMPARYVSGMTSPAASQLTAAGAPYLGFVALIPMIAFAFVGVGNTIPFGGTTILIAVGVGLDTVKQIESQLQQRNYEGFLR